MCVYNTYGGFCHPIAYTLGCEPAQFLYHIWREHTRVWDAMFKEVLARMGAPADGPPPDLPERILVSVHLGDDACSCEQSWRIWQHHCWVVGPE